MIATDFLQKLHDDCRQQSFTVLWFDIVTEKLDFNNSWKLTESLQDQNTQTGMACLFDKTDMLNKDRKS